MKLQIAVLLSSFVVINCQQKQEHVEHFSPSPSTQQSSHPSLASPLTVSPKTLHAHAPRSAAHNRHFKPSQLYPSKSHPLHSGPNFKLPHPKHSSGPPIHLVSHNTPPYGSNHKRKHLSSSLSLTPTYRPIKSGHAQYKKKGAHSHVSPYDEVPRCAYNSSKNWCLEDSEYPVYEIQGAAQKNTENFLNLYADVADLDTGNSVDGLHHLSEETYLCASETSYVRPLRAVNVAGEWRVIVNGIKVHYEEVTQTVRLEECEYEGAPCPLVPKCYSSSCLQKFVYHRFLVYDPRDVYFPFAIESFKMPASCTCLLGSYYVD